MGQRLVKGFSGGGVLTFSHHSALVRCRRINSGRVFVASWSGPLYFSAMESLRDQVADAALGAQCLILRIDRALDLMGDSPSTRIQSYRPGVAPGAIIVRADQYQPWADYADNMATKGIIRMVFLNSQLVQCQGWVEAELTAALAK